MLSRAHIRQPRDTYGPQEDHLVACGQRMPVNIGTYQMLSICGKKKLEREAHLETKNERDSKGGTGEVELS